MGCAHWLRIPQGEVGHSGCLRVKVEGEKSRTHKAQCPDSLARVQPKIITAERAILLKQLHNKFKNNYNKSAHLKLLNYLFPYSIQGGQHPNKEEFVSHTCK